MNNPSGNVRSLKNTESLSEDKEYKKIISIIENLWDTGVIQRGTKQCYSMSDIICKLLKQNGIDCYLEECALMIMRKNPPELNLVGYPLSEGFSRYNDGGASNSLKEMQTHVVCITRTKYPLLIDLSIFEYSEDVPFICERINRTDITELAFFDFPNTTFSYSKRSLNQVPILHQQSIIDRIKTDKELFSSIDRINRILILIISIATLNFIRGGYDFYQKYINTTNGFGPNKIVIENTQ